jgi:hypothetical protein
MDTGDMQLGTVIMQGNTSKVFYICKLSLTLIFRQANGIVFAPQRIQD